MNHPPHRHEPPPFPEINDYCQALVPPRHPECVKMEEIARAEHFPIIGPACGHLLYLVTRMVRATTVFELGSGFGYSTYWFAQAVKDNGGGLVHHTVWEAELSARARDHLSAAGLSDLVEFHVGEAIGCLRETGGTYDVLFCDIDKQAYPEALAEMEKHVRSGGLVAFDNLLLHGAVLPSHKDRVPPPTEDPAFQERRARREADLRGVQEVSAKLFRSPAWIASLIPLRDGIGLALKVGA